MTTSPRPIPEPQEPPSGCLSIAVRLTWIFGASLLIFGAIYILRDDSSGLADIVYWLIALGLVLARYVDIKYLKGQTSDNKPATLGHWRRYAAILVAAAGLLYLLAKILVPLDLL